jgi:hypothetical protein
MPYIETLIESMLRCEIWNLAKAIWRDYSRDRTEKWGDAPKQVKEESIMKWRRSFVSSATEMITGRQMPSPFRSIRSGIKILIRRSARIPRKKMNVVKSRQRRKLGSPPRTSTSFAMHCMTSRAMEQMFRLPRPCLRTSRTSSPIHLPVLPRDPRQR